MSAADVEGVRNRLEGHSKRIAALENGAHDWHSRQVSSLERELDDVGTRISALSGRLDDAEREKEKVWAVLGRLTGLLEAGVASELYRSVRATAGGPVEPLVRARDLLLELGHRLDRVLEDRPTALTMCSGALRPARNNVELALSRLAGDGYNTPGGSS